MAVPRTSVVMALLVALALDGCGDKGRLAVGWRFAGGRGCADAGVASMALGGPVACACGDAGNACDCRFTCQDGEGGRTVEVTVTREGTVTATGLSPEGNVLYRGSADVNSGATLTMDLYFTGGR